MDAGRVTRKMREQRELAGAKLDADSLEGDGARRRVDLERTAHDHRRAVDQAVTTQKRTHAGEKLGVAKRGPGHVVGTRLERAQHAGRRLAARAHPQDAHARRTRRKLARAERSQHVEASVRRAAEDDQIDLAGPTAHPQRPGVARAMDLVAVKRKLPGYPGVRPLLAVDEQHARAPARKLKRARVLLVIVGQRFLSRTEEGSRPRTRPMTVRS